MNSGDFINKQTVKLICDLIKIKCSCVKRRPLIHSVEECVENILKVLKTGQQWYTLGNGYSTYHKRFCEWSDKEVFSEAFYLLQKIPNFANSMGTSFSIDSCVIRNKCGREDISYCYKIKCKRSVKMTIIVGDNGLPVSLNVSKSSVHDIKFVYPALSKIKLRTRKIKTLIGDKGYQKIDFRKELSKRKINYLYGQKENTKKPFIMNDKEQKLFNNRFRVEGTFSTLLSNRRLNVRYEQKTKHFESFIYIAMIDMICKTLDTLKENKNNIVKKIKITLKK